MIADLVFLLLSALYKAGSLRDHHHVALRPFLERVAVDKTVILTQASLFSNPVRVRRIQPFIKPLRQR